MNSGDDAVDADLDEVRIGGEVRAAGGLHTISGLLTLLGGVQVAGTVLFRSDVMNWIPFVFIATGLVALVCGTQTYRGKSMGALVALVLAGLHLLAGGVWFFVLVGHGVGSLPVLLTPMFALGAVALGGYVMPRVLKIDRARKRLAAQGLSFGV